MKKKLLAVLLAASLGCTALAGCGSSDSDSSDSSDTTEEESSNTTEEESSDDESSSSSASGDYVYRVGFVNIDDSDSNCYPAMLNFIDYVESDEFAEAVGTEVEVLTADSELDIETQTNNVETLLTKGVDVMFIIGVDTEGNTTAVEQCNAEGVDVFMVGTEASGGEWKFVGFNEIQIGQAQGEYAVENLPENANICYIEGTPGREATEYRKQGLTDTIAERDDLTLLSSQPGNFSTEDSMQVTEDWILQYGDEMDVIVCSDNYSTMGAIEALKAADMIDEVDVYGLVGNEEDAENVANGYETYGVFLYWPMIGTLCGEIAEQYYLGEEIEDESNIELYDMTSDNWESLIDEIIG